MARFTSGTTRSFRPDIQGLRALAVGLVLLYHGGVPWFAGGYVGVDVFFVISGFLITGQLVASLERDGRIRLGEFYARRARRILPACLVVIALTVIAALLMVPPLRLRSVFTDAVASALYAPNVLFAQRGTAYLADDSPSLFQHYWSLGIEEQFYLIWPALLTVGFVLARRSTRRLALLIGLVSLASFLGCLLMMRWSVPWTFFLVFTRAWEFGAGALVAVFLRSKPAAVDARGAGVLASLGVTAIVASGLAFDDATQFPGLAALVPVLGAAAMILGGNSTGMLSPARLLSLGPVQHLGKISYSVYLVHWPLLMLPAFAVGFERETSPQIRLLLVASSLVLGHLSYRFVEEPFRIRGSVPARTLRRDLALAVIVPVGLGAAGLLGLRWTETLTFHDERSYQLSADFSRFPEGLDFVPANMRPSVTGGNEVPAHENLCHRDLNDPDTEPCRITSNPTAPTVALFGDSHAANWYPALAELALEGAIQLDAYTMSSCGSVTITPDADTAVGRNCRQWRDGVVTRLQAEPPDVVLLGNYSHNIVQPGDASTETVAAWKSAVAARAVSIPDETRVVLLADTPDFVVSPRICLSANTSRALACARPRDKVTSSDLRAAEQAIPGVEWLDMVDYLCNEETCPPVVQGYLLYADSHHLTQAFSLALADELGRELGVP